MAIALLLVPVVSVVCVVAAVALAVKLKWKKANFLCKLFSWSYCSDQLVRQAWLTCKIKRKITPVTPQLHTALTLTWKTCFYFTKKIMYRCFYLSSKSHTFSYHKWRKGLFLLQVLQTLQILPILQIPQVLQIPQLLQMLHLLQLLQISTTDTTDTTDNTDTTGTTASTATTDTTGTSSSAIYGTIYVILHQVPTQLTNENMSSIEWKYF